MKGILKVLCVAGCIVVGLYVFIKAISNTYIPTDYMYD